MTANWFNYLNSGGFKLCTEIMYAVQNAAEDDLHRKSDNQSWKWPELRACLESLCLFHHVEGTDWTTVGRKRCTKLASLPGSCTISHEWSWKEKRSKANSQPGWCGPLQGLTVLLFREWPAGGAHGASYEKEAACAPSAPVRCPNELSYLFHGS